MKCELVLGRDDPDPKFPVSFSRDQTIPEITTTMASGVVEGVLWGYTLLNIHEYSPRLFRGEHLLCIRDKNDVTCQ